MNTFNLSRFWFSFAYNNPQVKPVHTALYFWIINRANTSGWKVLVDIQTEKSMECLGITDWRTYKNALQFLTDSGFIKWIEKSRNQYTCNRISLVENSGEISESFKNSLAQNAEPNAEAIAEALVEAYAEPYVKAIAEALQSYINPKTNKPKTLKPKKQGATLSLAFENEGEVLEVENKIAPHTGAVDPRRPWAKDISFEDNDTPELRAKWAEWIAYKFNTPKKKPYTTQRGEQAELNKLKKFSTPFALYCIDLAIDKEWLGVTNDGTAAAYQQYANNPTAFLTGKTNLSNSQTNGQSTYTNRQQSTANGVGADLETAVAMSRLIVSDGYKQAG